MKRYVLVGLCILFILTFLISISLISSASYTPDRPTYTSECLSEFNSKYTYQFTWNFVFPVGLEGNNPSLFGFYPFIISHQDRYIIFFAKTFSYSGSEGILRINFVDAFSYVSNTIDILDVSSITVPDSLLSFNTTFNFEDGIHIRDEYGNISYLIYLPSCTPLVGDTEEYLSLSGLEVTNHFVFPQSGEAGSVLPELTYSQVFSYDPFSYSPSEGFDTEAISGGIDIDGAVDNLDDDIHDARGAFHKVFSTLLDSLSLGPILILILTVSLSFFVIGRH